MVREKLSDFFQGVFGAYEENLDFITLRFEKVEGEPGFEPEREVSGRVAVGLMDR